MRRKRRARSVFTILSLVMAITVMLGSFMAFADESSDWQEQNRDQGPASNEVNLLEDRRDEKVYSWQKNLLGDDHADVSVRNSRDEVQALNSTPPVGLSGVWQIGYSEPPLGYSMTVTYDWFGEEAPEGVESIGPNGGEAPALGFSVIVKDGDLVPDDAALNVWVDADVPAGASARFNVLFNEEQLENEGQNLINTQFRGKHTVTEDGVIVVEPQRLLFAPMSFISNEIVIEENSLYLSTSIMNRLGDAQNPGTTSAVRWNRTTTWTTGYESVTWNLQWRCLESGCTGSTVWSNFTPAITATTNNSGNTLAAAPMPGSYAYAVNRETHAATHRQYHCDATRYNAANTSARTITIKDNPHDSTNVFGTTSMANTIGANWWNHLVTGTGGTYTNQANNASRQIIVNNTSGVAAAVTFPGTLPGTGKVIFTGPVTMTTTTINRPVNFGNGADDGSLAQNPVYVVASGGSGTITFQQEMTGHLELTGQNVEIIGTNAIIGDGTQFVPGFGGSGSAGPGVITEAGTIKLDDGTVNQYSQVVGTSTGSIVKGTVNGLVRCDSDISITTVNLGTTGMIKSDNGDITVGVTNGTGTYDGTLEAWLGTVTIPSGMNSPINRINAKDVVIPLGNTNVINTLSLRENGGSRTISFNGQIGVFFAGGGAGSVITVDSPTKITSRAYAGAESKAVAGCILNLDGVTNASGGNIPRVYAGGMDNVTSTSTINVNSGTLIADLHGGNNSTIKRFVTNPILNLNNGSIVTNVHGGGFGSGTNNSISGDATVSNPVINIQNLPNGSVGTVYGGRDSGNGAVNNIVINVGTAGTSGAAGKVTGSVYGGNRSGSGTAELNTITINVGVGRSGEVGNSVYGGHYDTTAKIVGDVKVNIGGGAFTATVGTGSNAGHVFGGGRSGSVDSAVVNIDTGSKIKGSVYGGGYGNDITKTTEVNIIEDVAKSTNLGGNIYGGGMNGTVYDTTVNITGTVDGNHIYGGSSGTGAFTNNGGTSTSAKVNINNDVDNANVYGGSATANISATGGTVVVIDTGVTIDEGSVYGANETGGEVYSTSITNNGDVTGTAVSTGQIYGAHSDASTTGTITEGVTIANNGTVANNIYGGAAKGTLNVNGMATTKSVEIENTFANLACSIFGGNATDSFTAANGVYINNVAVMSTGSIYGGNEAGTYLTNGGGVLIENDNDLTLGSIYGGSKAGDFTTVNDGVTIENTASVDAGAIYGGSENGSTVSIAGGVSITNTGNSANGIFGGSKETSSTNTISGGVTIHNTSTGAVQAVGIYGGNETTADGTNTINGGVKITNDGNVVDGIYGGTMVGDFTINGTTVYGVDITNSATGTVGNVGIYGGSKYSPGTGTTEIFNGTHIVNSGDVDENIYGGAFNGESIIHNYTGTNSNGTAGTGTYIEMLDGTVNGAAAPNGSIYGGNAIDATGAVDSTRVEMSGGTVDWNVYGGGRGTGNSVGSPSPGLPGSTTVVVSGGTINDGTVFGGGREGSTVYGTTDVSVGITINNGNNIYGGGEDSRIVGDTKISVLDFGNLTEIANVFGGGTTRDTTINGGWGNATVTGNTEVNIDNATAIITYSVYGGGEGNNVNTDTASNPDAKTVVNMKAGTVNENVYGGGLQSTVNDTFVNVSGGQVGTMSTVNFSNVFGGGTNALNASTHAGGTTASVGRNTHVNITGGQIGVTASVLDNNSSVYGGGENTLVNGITTVTMSAGTVTNDVYGGGWSGIGDIKNTGGAPTATQVTITGVSLVEGSVYGGGHLGGDVDTGNTLVEIFGSARVVDDVFGGGYNNAHIRSGNTKVHIKDTADIGTDSYGTTPVDVVAGGGTGNLTFAEVNGNTEVLMEGGTVRGSIYGGGYNELNLTPCVVTGNTTVTVDGANAKVQTHVYGGGYNSGSDVKGATGTTVKILNGWVEHNVYGGGDNNAKIDKDTYIQIEAKVGTTTPGQDPNPVSTDDVVYGGGTGVTGSTVGGKTLIDIGLTGSPVIIADVHGGGDGTGNPILGAGGSEINFKNGTTTGNMIGGGHDSDVQTAKITHEALLYGDIWGGGISRTADANVTPGGTTVVITGGKVFYGTNSKANVSGGGVSTAGFTANVDADVDIDITAGSEIDGSVFGGGEGQASQTADIKGNVDILVEDSTIKTDLWGAGHHGVFYPTVTTAKGQATVFGNVNMKLDSAIIGTTGGNVYGGGNDNKVVGRVDILTDGDTVIHKDIYGGGKGTSDADRDATTINVSNTEDEVIHIILQGNTNVKGNVYGGGSFCDVFGSIDLDVISKHFEQNIYGGCRNGIVEHHTDVWVAQDAEVGKSVFGGGIKDSPAGQAPSDYYVVEGHTNVLIEGHIHENVWGGGHWSDVNGIGGTTVVINGDGSAGNPTKGHGVVDFDVSGGGLDGNITHAGSGTEVTVQNSAYIGQDVYGGGYSTTGIQTPGIDYVGNVEGSRGTRVIVIGVDDANRSVVARNVYGGGRNFGDIMHGTYVLLDDFSEIGRTHQVRGDVFGGGNYGHVHGSEGTQVTQQPYSIIHGTVYGGCYFADLTHANGGTEVYIYGQLGDTYHTQSYTDTRPSFYDDYDVYGVDSARTGNVYGGGNHGNIDGDRGTMVHVTDRPVSGKYTGSNNDKAVIWNSTYGGGFEGDVKFDTIVKVNGGANVYNSVFGGGQQHKDNQSDPAKIDAARVYGTTTVEVTESDTKIGHWEVTALTDNLGLTGGRANHSDPQYVNNDDLELHTGRIFGGGDYATIQGTTNVLIEDLAQIAFRTISGGNFGVHSGQSKDGSDGDSQERNVTLNRLGKGEGSGNAYDDLSVYTVIKHLCDYTNSYVNDDYLTVYYHLRSVDDNSDNGLAYLGYYPKDSMEYSSIFVSTGGKYHSWRPYPHKDIIVDPFLRMGNTMFRMEAGYTIDLRPGGHENISTAKTELLIDRDHRRLTATSKIYGPSNNVKDPDSFAYNHLPNTLNPKNLLDSVTTAICGIRFYIPPIEIKQVGGESTNFGGTDILDQTTGNNGAPEYETTDRTVSVRANEKDLIGKVQDAVKKTAKGKTAYVSESRYDQITPEVLANVGKAAVTAGGKTILMFDTMNGNSVQGRIYIDPAKPLPKNAINTRVYTEAARLSQSKVNFENYYKNDFAFVQLGQNGSFGIEVEIAAKVNLQKLDTKNLIFYAYSESANSYKRIENPRYFIDNNGYLHFYTAVGGTIVVTDEPLTRK